MTDRPCPLDHCGAALSRDETICRGCATKLRLDLREVPALLVELDLALSRQTSMPPAGGLVQCARQDCSHDVDEPGCVAGVRLVYDVRAGEARMGLVTCLHGWARVWDEETPFPTPLIADEWAWRSMRSIRDRVLSSTAGQAGVLASMANLGSRPWAADLAREVRDAVTEGWRAVDRPPDTTVVGRCPECGRALYGPEGADVVRCRNCGATCNRIDVREASLAESRKLVTADELGMVLADGDEDLAKRIAARVRQWRVRGRIVVVRMNLKGQPLYRVADGQALLRRGEDEVVAQAIE